MQACLDCLGYGSDEIAAGLAIVLGGAPGVWPCEPCGWTGDERDNAPTAVHDAADHLKLNAPRGKDS